MPSNAGRRGGATMSTLVLSLLLATHARAQTRWQQGVGGPPRADHALAYDGGSWSLPIPNANALRGLSFFVQGMEIGAVSNAGRVTIGAF